MRKTFAAVVVVGLAFMTAGALCASGQDGEIEGYFEMVGEELLGVAPRLDLRRTGESRTGEKAREEFDLQAGRRCFIFGACDADCSDIRLRLLGPEGASVDEDIRRGSRKAQVYFAPETSGVLAVEVSMVECAAASCGWAVQAYAHGTPFSDAARRPRMPRDAPATLRIGVDR